MEEAGTDFNDNVKKLNQLRNDYTTMEHNLTVGLNNLLQEQLDEVHKLNEKLRKIEETNEIETVAVKQQVGNVAQIRDKIKKEVFALNSRIEAAEVDVGYE